MMTEIVLFILKLQILKKNTNSIAHKKSTPNNFF